MRFFYFSICLLLSTQCFAEEVQKFESPDLQYILESSKTSGLNPEKLIASFLKTSASRPITHQLVLEALRKIKDVQMDSFELKKLTRQELGRLTRQVFKTKRLNFCNPSTAQPEQLPNLEEMRESCKDSWKNFLEAFKFASPDIMVLRAFGEQGQLKEVFFFLTSIYQGREYLIFHLVI